MGKSTAGKKETNRKRKSMGAVGTEHKSVWKFEIIILLREQLLSQLVSNPTRRDWTCCLQTEMGWWEMWWLEAVWGTVIMKLWNF